jgi:hypothetical protein
LNQFINPKAKPLHQVNKLANFNQMEPIQRSYPSKLINQTQKNQQNKVVKKKKKGTLASKVAKFQQNQSNLAIPISIKQTQSYP